MYDLMYILHCVKLTRIIIVCEILKDYSNNGQKQCFALQYYSSLISSCVFTDIDIIKWNLYKKKKF